MRRLLLVPLCATALLCAPGVASADVIFDPADADELAATLADAYDAQGVCYGWSISVDNEGLPETSVGSNFGAGQSLQDAGSGCDKTVEFTASISWTPESSESEDSASYGVTSSTGSPTVDGLDDLDIISEDGLKGDDVDVDVYKAVAALPLLAADAGIAKPIEASPAAEADSGDAVPTDSPGGDFWRESGMQILWGSLILLAGVVFAWYTIRSSRRPARRTIGPAAEQLPDPEPAQPEPVPEPASERVSEPESEREPVAMSEFPAEPRAEGPEPAPEEPAAAEQLPDLEPVEPEPVPEPASEPASERVSEPELERESKATSEFPAEPRAEGPEPAPEEPAAAEQPAETEKPEKAEEPGKPTPKPDPETRPDE